MVGIFIKIAIIYILNRYTVKVCDKIICYSIILDKSKYNN